MNRKCCSRKCVAALLSQRYKGDKKRAKQLRQASKLIDHNSPDRLRRRSELTKSLFKTGKLQPRRGKDNNLWKGGVTPEYIKARVTPEYKQWRTAVLTRDGFMCADCGETNDLHVHHIKSFSKYPELRTVISNGITVCLECHGKRHNRKLQNIGKVKIKA